MKNLSKLLLSVLIISVFSCGRVKTYEQEESVFNEHEKLNQMPSVVTEDKNFETSTFTSIPGKDMTRVPLCPVIYYVEDGVLYSSEKYHALYLVYSNDSTNKMTYQYSIIFDTKQEPDSAGWVSLDFKGVDIPRIPNTHLSGIIMRNYYGPLVDESTHSHGWPDAVLFNSTKEIANGRDKNMLNPQLEKLLNYIK